MSSADGDSLPVVKRERLDGGGEVFASRCKSLVEEVAPLLDDLGRDRLLNWLIDTLELARLRRARKTM